MQIIHLRTIYLHTKLNGWKARISYEEERKNEGETDGS